MAYCGPSRWTMPEDRRPVAGAIEHETAVFVVGGLTVAFEVTYIGGPAGDRLAERQADAIAALLAFVEDREHER